MSEENFNLPENAYRELKEGEEYKPILHPKKNYKEVTTWSIVLGLLMAVIFSAAAAYSGLKIGQVFEAAIPISIIARSTLSEKSDPLRSKCYYSIYWSQFRRCSSWRCIYYPSFIYFTS